jgi:hypothetical protein
MRKRIFHTIANFLLFLLMHNFAGAQAVQNCYANYKKQGDNYKNQGIKNNNDKASFSSAKQQYLYAKNCSYLTNSQRIEIDSLIKDIDTRLQPAVKKAYIPRKYYP